MKKKLRFFSIMIFLTCHWIAFGQGKTITGKVTDDTNMPLPGVSVVINGTTKGTITDVNGAYSLSVGEDQDMLIYSFIGFESQKVTIANRTTINIQLKPEVFGMEEVVVVGYGTSKKSDLSGASVSVSGEKLKGTVGANLDQAMQGRAAGVTAVITSGQPGAGVSIRIRGQGTLRADAAEPLYVVDGVPVQNVSQGGHSVGLGSLGNASTSTFSGLSSINPSDILSMEILKDASATAIYGARGSNGVVLITTKRGKSGDAKFQYDFNYGIQEQYKRIDMMNLREYAEYCVEYANDVQGVPQTYLLDPSILGEGTDWQGGVFRVAPMQSHQISAEGGSDKMTYYVSGSYINQDGIMIGSDFERFTSRLNLTADLKEWFKLGTNVSINRSNEHIGLTNSDDGIISVALRSAPDVPIYNTDGSYSGDEREGSAGSVNPIAKALDEENRLTRSNIALSAFAELKPIKGLTWRTEGSTNISGSNAYQFMPTFEYGSKKNEQNSVTRQYNQNLFWEFKNYATYSREIKKHSATLMFGQEVSEWMYETLRGYATSLPSNDIHEPGLAEKSNQEVGSGRGSGAMASFFGRLNYDYGDKYYLTYTFRRDGSSNFGPERRWAPFHAFSLSWRVSNEPFMAGLTDVISNLKIRGGWGQTGNASIDGYSWGSAINKMPTGLGMGYKQSNIANPYVQWESQESINLGVDLGLLQNKIELTVDIYRKESKEMLMRMQLPSYMGTSGNASARLNSPMGNFGSIRNQGLEISLNTHPIDKALKWDSEFQLTFNNNKLLGLTGTPAAHIEGNGQWNDLVSVTEIGESLYNFYGYQVEGVYTDYNDIMNSAKSDAFPENGVFSKGNTVWVGDLKFKDISGPTGVKDGVINEFDRTNLGSPLPIFTYGFNNTFRFKNIELNVFLSGSYGNKVLNYVRRNLDGMNSMWGNQLGTVVDRAKIEVIDPTMADASNVITNVRLANEGTSMPRAIAGDPNNNMRISDRYVEDGSYLRIKNIALAYYVPQSILTKLHVTNLKLYANIQNVWTFTEYTGFDPEVGASQTSENVYGMDSGRYPSPRIYSLGFNLSF